MTRSRSLSSAEEAASAWFMRRRERASDNEAEQAFQAWLAQSPQHRQEYEKLAQVWDDLASLPRSAIAQNRASLPFRIQAMLAASRVPAQRRSVFPRWAGALAALVLAAGTAYQYLPVSYQSVANAATQTRRFALADGTRIHANVGTRVSVRYTLAERHIDIENGEVYINAAPDRRPLVVSAGGARLRDIGTEFNVLLLPDLLQIGVRSGQVRLDVGGATRRSAQTLHAGDTVLFTRADARLLARAQVPLGEIGAWQEGVVVVHDVTLQHLAGYLALYRAAPLRFADERARGLRLSGTLDLRHPEALLDALPDLLAVTISRQPDGTAVIASR